MHKPVVCSLGLLQHAPNGATKLKVKAAWSRVPSYNTSVILIWSLQSTIAFCLRLFRRSSFRSVRVIHPLPLFLLGNKTDRVPSPRCLLSLHLTIFITPPFPQITEPSLSRPCTNFVYNAFPLFQQSLCSYFRPHNQPFRVEFLDSS